MTTALRTARPRPVADRTMFWGYVCRFIRHPRRTWLQLLADPARLRYGSWAVLLVALGYTLTIACIAISDGTASPPWLAIPRGVYFRWEVLFVAPVTLLCWILAAGVTHLLSKLGQGKGSFEDTLALLGFAVALPTLVSLVPDFIRSVLTATGVLDRHAWEQAVAQPGTGDWLFLWSYMLLYGVGLFCLFPLALKSAEGLRRWPSVLIGGIGALVYGGGYLIFIR